MLEDPKNEKKIDEILDKVCKYVPQSVQKKVITIYKFLDRNYIKIDFLSTSNFDEKLKISMNVNEQLFLVSILKFSK